MNFIPSSSNKERVLRLLYIAWALVVAILYDIFFWQKDMGLGFLLFVVLLVVGTVVLLAATRHLRQTWALLLIIPIFILSLDIVLYNTVLVRGPASLVVAGLLLVLFVLLPLRNHDKVGYYFRDIPLIRNLHFFKHWATMYRDLFRWKDLVVQRDYKKVAIGLVIAAPILLIFLALFTSADGVFAEALKKVFNFTLPDNALIFIWRMLRTIGITVLLGGLFYIFIHEEHAPIKGIIRSVMKFDSTIVTVIFTTVNLLFFIFVIFQISYLFGNQAYVMEKGLTYAEYARSGFFQLAWVIALASLLLLVPYRSFAEHGLKKVLVVLKLILIIEILVIAFSALKRMNLYQDIYGFTTQRLYVEWLIYMAMVWLVMLGVAIVTRWKFKRLFYATVCLGLTSFVIVASINVDRMIARKNVDRFLVAGSIAANKVDIFYLLSLSYDAVPDIVRGLPEISKYISMISSDSKNSNPSDVIKNYLADTYEKLNKKSDWREYNLGRAQARESIGNYLGKR
jgi:hypothetical protein